MEEVEVAVEVVVVVGVVVVVVVSVVGRLDGAAVSGLTGARDDHEGDGVGSAEVGAADNDSPSNMENRSLLWLYVWAPTPDSWGRLPSGLRLLLLLTVGTKVDSSSAELVAVGVRVDPTSPVGAAVGVFPELLSSR